MTEKIDPSAAEEQYVLAEKQGRLVSGLPLSGYGLLLDDQLASAGLLPKNGQIASRHLLEAETQAAMIYNADTDMLALIFRKNTKENTFVTLKVDTRAFSEVLKTEIHSNDVLRNSMIAARANSIDDVPGKLIHQKYQALIHAQYVYEMQTGRPLDDVRSISQSDALPVAHSFHQTAETIAYINQYGVVQAPSPLHVTKEGIVKKASPSSSITLESGFSLTEHPILN